MYEVVRIQNQNLWTEEYGCRHIAMGKSRENYDRRKKEHYIKKDSDPVPVGGMVLSDDLYNESGKVLLIRAGERITRKNDRTAEKSGDRGRMCHDLRGNL